ncbi:MFS transporter [Geodermatophilus sp. TF02-6]|uniref:MFS transporter n=1 Tax=Geodermatophilus sp. TF02-6 TaxID=2250575 RepID=UPI0018F3658D|nr:MFS transporter [Geodermatophilus sp. TF02-6]
MPVALVALAAVAALLPESRSARPGRVDPLGILSSSAGLTALVSGLIRAGDRGWDDAAALALLAGGVLGLGAVVLRERRTDAPLVDPSLFRSRAFTGGTAVAAVVTAALAGVLFAVPQYLQGVLDADALGTGLRLLPLIGGLLVGAQGSDRLARRGSVRVRVTAGCLVLAAGLAAAATTGADSGYGFAACWLALTGIGLGASLPAAMDAAIGVLSDEGSGVGSAVVQALRQVGAALGVAVLGSLLASLYRTGVDTDALPPAAAEQARAGLPGGAAVARELGAPALLQSARDAFVHGMDVAFWVAAGAAAACALLAAALLPRPGDGAAEERAAESPHDVPATR